MNIKEIVGGLVDNLSKIDGVSYHNDVETVPIGLDIIDTITGGGFPENKISVLSGSAGCGKSTLAAQIIAGFQKKYQQCIAIYIDVEQGMATARLENVGCDMSRTIIASRDITLETCCSIVDNVIAYKIENKLKDLKIIIVVDSESALKCTKELEAEDPNKVLGVKAKMLGCIIPKWNKQASQYDITFIIISQLRAKISIGYSASDGGLKGLNDTNITGGYIMQYMPFLLAKMRPRESLDPEVYGFAGVATELSFIKNRNFPPHIKVDLVLNYSKGFDPFWTKHRMVQNAKEIKGTAWQYLSNYPEFKFRKRDIEKHYNENEEFRNKFDLLYKKCEYDVLVKSGVCDEQILATHKPDGIDTDNTIDASGEPSTVLAGADATNLLNDLEGTSDTSTDIDCMLDDFKNN